MNILVVSQYFWPEDFRINDLVREWQGRGHRVVVLTGTPNYPGGRVFPEFARDPDAFKNYGDASVLRVPMLARSSGSLRLVLNYISFVLGASLWGPLLLGKHQPDVIFVFGPSPVTVGLPAVLLGRIKRAPVVFWVLDLWPETLAAVGVVKSPRLLSLVGLMVGFIYNRCTLVLGQSQAFLGGITRYCRDANKVRYFPSWAEEVYDATFTEPAHEVTAQESVFNVMFAGNIGEAQDFPAILDAADLLRKKATVRWLIVGDGRKLEWVQAEVQRRGLESQVILLGRFPVERMPSFFAHADALLVSLKKDPAFSMTIPGKVQSYLLSGIPVLGMLDGEGARVISEAGAGLVCPAGDSVGLAGAVMTLMAMDASEREAMGHQGRAYGHAEFGRGALMDRLMGLLNEAVAWQQGKKS